MDHCWGIPASQDEGLGVKTVKETARSATVEHLTRTLGKRHAPGLDEVLGLCGRQRARESEDAAAKSDTSQKVVVKPHHPRKHRKSTHVARKVTHGFTAFSSMRRSVLMKFSLLAMKEEKERLLKEMETLNAQLVRLKQYAMASMGNADSETARRIQVGRKLRDDVQVNQQKFGEIASIMSEFSLCVRVCVGCMRGCMVS